MIRSCRCRETERLLYGHSTKVIPANIQRVARRKLIMLDSAADLRDLRIPPKNRLEALKGDRAGQYSVRINDQYRICFTWHNNDAYDVEIVDYHRG